MIGVISIRFDTSWRSHDEKIQLNQIICKLIIIMIIIIIIIIIILIIIIIIIRISSISSISS